MAEAALLAVGKSIVSKLTHLVAQEISLACCAKKELRKLQDSLGTINATLQAFEEGQYVRTLPTDNWLERLIDVVYDADDLLDEFTTEVARQRREKICFCTLDEVWEFSSRLLFNFTLGHQIKEIRKRLEAITLDRNNFHPTTQPCSHTSVGNVENIETLSDPLSVIGRNVEKDAIVQLLKKLESDSAQNVPVIPIFGMPGVGKTTLARFVFNDERINKHFDLRIWVYVSDDFDAKTIAKRIIEYITGKKCDDLQLGVVERLLGEQLVGKRYLLVLDDVWNENHGKWVLVKDLLKGGKEGSRILVTTRSNQVASVMSPVSRHIFLGPLSNDVDCWSMFKQRAFRIGEEEMQETLIPIGREIVRKCQGVPLAVTALGSILHSITDESYWSFVRDNEIWQLTEDVHRNQLGNSINILPILKLSYDHLPSHLKACFGFCSLFPKGYEIGRESLIQLWMAKGLIQSSPRQKLEDVGDHYFNILLSRSFFQGAVKDKYGNIISCKMHDLMHDLARSVAGKEYMIVGEDINEAPQGGDVAAPQVGSARHVSLFCGFNPQLFNATDKLRTLLNPNRLRLPYNRCLSFKCLRSLDLSWSNFERLPNSIGELEHLRYLDLSCSRIEEFPDSFSKLQNLQTLKLNLCGYLRELPKDMCKMVKLRHIIMNWRAKLTHMPPGLGQLSSLKKLSLFVVCDKIGSRISELGTLDGLRGGLYIENLECVRDLTDVVIASLENKQNLNFLALRWGSNDMENWHVEDWENWDGENWDLDSTAKRFARRQKQDEDVLERLHLPPNLRGLTVSGFVGVKFSSRRMSTLKRLVRVELYDLSECQHLSALGELPSLQSLHLENMPCVERISGGFISLQEVHLKGLPRLGKWEGSMAGDGDGTTTTEEGQSLCLPRLTTLEIKSCPSLVAMPFLPSLETWTLSFGGGELLRRSLMPSPTSATLSHLTRLESLQIDGCDDLEYLPAQGLQYLVSLKELRISHCGHLKSLPISQYITHLSINDCPIATWLEAEQSLPGFRSLQELSTDKLKKVVSLPNALQHATSLQKLELRDCPLLTSLPEWMQRLIGLEELTIVGCPHLYWRCQPGTGDDWAKIAHVPSKSIRNFW